MATSKPCEGTVLCVQEAMVTYWCTFSSVRLCVCLSVSHSSGVLSEYALCTHVAVGARHTPVRHGPYDDRSTVRTTPSDVMSCQWALSGVGELALPVHPVHFRLQCCTPIAAESCASSSCRRLSQLPAPEWVLHLFSADWHGIYPVSLVSWGHVVSIDCWSRSFVDCDDLSRATGLPRGTRQHKGGGSAPSDVVK